MAKVSNTQSQTLDTESPRQSDRRPDSLRTSFRSNFRELFDGEGAEESPLHVPGLLALHSSTPVDASVPVVTPIDEFPHLHELQNSKGRLQLGDRGDAVSELQQLLNRLGAGIKVNGEFGKETQSALRDCLTQMGLSRQPVLDGSALERLFRLEQLNSPYESQNGLATPEGDRLYRVKKNDTLTTLSRHFYGDDREIARIRSANPELHPKKIQIGDLVIVPDPEKVKSERKQQYEMFEPKFAESLQSVAARALTKAEKIEFAKTFNLGPWAALLVLNPDMKTTPVDTVKKVRARYSPGEAPEISIDPGADKRIREVLDRPLDPISATSKAPENVRKFVETYKDAALDVERRYFIPAELVLAAAGYESGWGGSNNVATRKRIAETNNLFGIKYDPELHSGYRTQPTTEFVDGKRVHRNAKFATFSSTAESLSGYGEFLVTEGPYTNIFAPGAGENGTLRTSELVDRIIKAGYSTNPSATRDLRNILRWLSREPTSDEVKNNPIP